VFSGREDPPPTASANIVSSAGNPVLALWFPGGKDPGASVEVLKKRTDEARLIKTGFLCALQSNSLVLNHVN